MHHLDLRKKVSLLLVAGGSSAADTPALCRGRKPRHSHARGCTGHRYIVHWRARPGSDFRQLVFLGGLPISPRRLHFRFENRCLVEIAAACPNQGPFERTPKCVWRHGEPCRRKLQTAINLKYQLTPNPEWALRGNKLIEPEQTFYRIRNNRGIVHLRISDSILIFNRL